MMPRLALPALLLLLSACASPPADRNPVLMDSGLPLSVAREQYEVRHFTLDHDILVDERSISGSATIRFRALAPMSALELDFDGQYDIRRVTGGDAELDYLSTPSTLTIELARTLDEGEDMSVTVHYAGQPVVARRPPWEGGFVWATSPSGKPWIATAFQGEGCDIWWPCKDHPSGEPREGMDLYFTVPSGLTVVSNGVLRGVEAVDDGRRQRFHWQTRSMINTYGVSLNIGPYVQLESRYRSTNGTEVPVYFWALEEREAQARELFDTEFQPIIDWFEQRFGPYPWGHEKLGVVETPHLGMEHQTINAYGNEYRRDAYGFDWLFHHELAHEWFGNLMTHRTTSDMWLHEGFGAYVQALYTLDTLGDAAYHARMFGMLEQIRGCVAMAPRDEVSDDALYFADNGGPGPDIYAKGAWVLHTLRRLLGDAAFYEATRILLYDTPSPDLLAAPIAARFRSSDDFLAILNDVSGEDYGWLFDAYVRSGPLPELRVEAMNGGSQLRWITADGQAFPMPVDVRIGDELRRLSFEQGPELLPGVSPDEMVIDPYLDVLRQMPAVTPCETQHD